MKKNPTSERSSSKVAGLETGMAAGSETPPIGMRGGTTGRYLVLLREGATEDGINTIQKTTGRPLTTAGKALGILGIESAERPQGIVFEKLGVAVVESPPDTVQGMLAEASTESSPIMHVEPERFVFALATAPTLVPVPVEEEVTEPAPAAVPTPYEYLEGYRDAVNHVISRVLDRSGAVEELEGMAVIATRSEAQFTWGIQVTHVPQSKFTGRSIRVAVLDTGLDLGHPDFIGRNVTSQSFVTGEQVQDGHGHGTHCIGTACGPRQPGRLPRYGIAFNSEIFAGKVLSNQGRGSDAQILAGIEWAIENKCAVVSMSLGAPVQPGEGFSQVFEQVGRRALAAGTLIIAAAGNESQRPQFIAPVGHPANCPSIMAIGALTQRIKVAPFSCAGLNPQGGQVDIAAPGVAVRSSWPRPMLYNTISGTSMATPHVAGIAALFAEAQPQARGLGLWALLIQHARHLGSPSRDVGAGLVQAP